MPEVKSGDTVSVHYTGTLSDDTVFDSSEGREPLTFTVGSGQVIPGFDAGVLGMQPGESKTFTIPADEAYGKHDQEMVIRANRSQFPDGSNPEVGDQFELGTQDGGRIAVTVTDVTEDEITLDANHPLAGEDLTFKIDLVEIR